MVSREVYYMHTKSTSLHRFCLIILFFLALFVFVTCEESPVAPITGPPGRPVADPTFTARRGDETVLTTNTVFTTDTLLISTTTDGATIHYTTNGDTPTREDPGYSSPVNVSFADIGTGSRIIKAIAVKSGLNNSNITEKRFTISSPPRGPVVPTITAQRGDGTVLTTNTVLTTDTLLISSTTDGATIHYTTDGSSTPTSSSEEYSNPVFFSTIGTGSKTIMAIAVKDGIVSRPASRTFTVNRPRVEPPTINPEAEDVVTTDSMTISTGTTGATIYYTVGTEGGADPADPRTAATRREYEEPVSFGASHLGAGTYTIKAFAKKEGYTDSTVVEKTFTITFSDTVVKPSITARDEEENGISTGILTIDTFAISTGTMGATIYYTVGPNGGTNPADPRTASTSARTKYTVPVSFGESPLGVGTYKIWAFAEMTGLNDSPLAMETFTVSQAPKVVTPSIDPSSGNVPNTDPLTIRTTTVGATIHYTSNGDRPDISSDSGILGSSLLSVLLSSLGMGEKTVKAIAVKSRHANSDEASATFTIRDPVAKPSITVQNEDGATITTNILTTHEFVIKTTPSDATIYYTVGPEGGVRTQPIREQRAHAASTQIQ